MLNYNYVLIVLLVKIMLFLLSNVITDEPGFINGSLILFFKHLDLIKIA